MVQNLEVNIVLYHEIFSKYKILNKQIFLQNIVEMKYSAFIS